MKKLLFILSICLLGACQGSLKIKDGTTAFRYKKYTKAIGMLKEEFQKARRTDDQAQKAYLIGESYMKINEYNNANEWYQTSSRLGYGVPAIRGAAHSYKYLEQYEEAIRSFEELKNLMPGDQSIQREILICRQAQRWKEEDPDMYSLRKIRDDHRYADYSPALYEDGLLVFTSDMEASTGSSRYDWTGNKMSDLYIMDKRGGEARKFDAFINSPHNEGTAVFTSDYNEMYFTRCYNSENRGDERCKLMVSFREQGIWSEPRPLSFIKEDINYGQPALIENDSVLVFSSVSEDGANGYDLWYTVRAANGWSAPYPFPSTINTQGNEYFPTGDGDTLYFSSDYLPGMGGLDIFKTYLDRGSWAPPVNIKLPFNSGADDFGLIIDRKDKPQKSIVRKGYFTSTRSQLGNEDIYYFEEYAAPDAGTDTNEDPTITSVRKIDLFLAGKIVEAVFADENDPNSGITGKKALEGSFVEVFASTGEKLDISANNRGLFIGNLEIDKTYTITAKKRGYLTQTMTLDPSSVFIPEEAESYTINVELLLDKIFTGKEIILSNIYYDFNESFIREDAKPTLDDLALKLRTNPQIRIELSSHTDCRGEEDFNLGLSQRRAESAVAYLIQKSIHPDRLVAKGYGERIPLADCPCDSCTEDEHQLNRRTAFKILEQP